MSEHITAENRQMAEVLAKIVTDKRQWVEARKVNQPLDSFKQDLVKSDRDFYQALTSDRAAFILECKKASPSKGLIRDDFNLDYIASVYNKYANAISILTDEKYFQGNFEFLPRVRSQVSQPILCKDFMIDTYQVYLARHYSADAILLMLSVLNDQEYQQLAEVADSLGLGILTEVSNEQELARAISLKARVIGINNRNLRDLTIDLNRTKVLAKGIPEGTIILSESGIYNNQQVRDLRSHANGFLIGSSLMAEDDLELAVRKVLIGEHKVCGLTRMQDAHSVYQAGAIFGGLIFAEGSRRKVDIDTARAVISGAPLRYVGVFQNQSIEQVVETASQLNLSAVQLHGDEDQAYIDQLKPLLAESCQIWKAYGVSDSVPELLTGNIDRHLLDSKVGTQSGGTGVSFDWSLINQAENIMLAGGLSPDNAKQAASLGCLGLDLNSGVESAPGIKESELIEQAFAQIKDF